MGDPGEAYDMPAPRGVKVPEAGEKGEETGEGFLLK